MTRRPYQVILKFIVIQYIINLLYIKNNLHVYTLVISLTSV